MKSKTKYPITPKQLQAVFDAANLGEIIHSKPMTDGWYNTVVCVTTEMGKFVIKVATHPNVRVLRHERNILAQELRYIALLKEHGVNVPVVRFHDLSKVVIPCDYFVMEHLPGQRLDKAGGDAEQQKNAVLAAFHAIKGNGFGYEQLGFESNWYLALKKMVQALIDDCADFGKKCKRGEKLLALIEQHREILEPVPCVFVNFDLHNKNLFWHEGELTVLDLERCFWGDRMGDYVYGSQPKDITPEEKIRRDLMSCYLAVVAYTEKYSRYRPWNATWWEDVAMQKYFWRG